MVLIADNIGGSQNGGNLSIRTILQGVGSKHETGIHELDIMVENRKFSGRTVLTPVGSQHIFFIHQRTPIKIVTQIVQTVIIQAVCQQGSIPVDHFHILAQLRYLSHAVIKQIVTIDEKSISLLHTHIAECFE